MDKKEQKEINLENLKQTKNKNFFTAFGHALDGVIKSFKTERNLRIDFIIGLFVLIVSLFFDFTKTEFACLCLTIGFVIFSEMINSTVEYVVDLITDKYDDRAKAAKDIAAGGVLVSAGVATVVGYFLFADKVYNLSTNVISSILDSKLHVLFIIIFAIVLFAVILKGMFGKGESYSKAYPSARVALAFGLTTYLYIVTRSLFVSGVSFILSVLLISFGITTLPRSSILLTIPVAFIFSSCKILLYLKVLYQKLSKIYLFLK